MGEKIRGGFGDYNSGDNDSSNVVNFEGWKRDHGYSVSEEVASSDTASESVDPGTTSETTDTKNNDELLLGQVKVEKASLFTAEKLMTFAKHGIDAFIRAGNIPPALAEVISIGIDGIFDSEPVKSFAKKVDDFEFDDFMIERQQKKMAREAGQPTPDQV